ncbi:hypothetical protein BH688_02665 [Kushneria phosphatilytica]|nr:hypothetical protein BH688_02665 [Kushneria phosphatilytica]
MDSSTCRVGLVPAPELPRDIAEELCDELPDLLVRHLDDRYQWQVQMKTDPLIGAEEETREMLHQAQALSREQGWDYVVCLTDLPLYRNGRLVIAEGSGASGVILISQPALGASPMRKRIREAIIQMLSELHHGSSSQARDRQQQHNDCQSEARRESGLYNNNARELVGWRLSERIAPIRRITPSDDADISVRFIADSRLRGHCKLLAGMVRANRPWTIFPAFRKIIAVAFATGAYGLLFPTLWRLSDAYSIWRFVLLMLAAMVAMVTWIIIDHGLWEPQRRSDAFPMAALYNLTTLITLGVGVLFYYAILLIMFLAAVFIFVPDGLLQSTLGHEVSPWHYPALAWLTSSVATIAGALGAGLESDETVRSATYGYRQKSRQQRVQQLKGQQKESASSPRE